MSKDKVRINLKAYDHQLLDVAAGKIVETVKELAAKFLDLFHYQQKLKKLQY